MKNVVLFITLLIGSVSFGQTISINGSLHSTNGEKTFPIWVEAGTTIQPNSPIKSISVKEFNVIPNSNGNDLVFNKTILVYGDSVSTVPEGKTWKLESIQNRLQLGDEYAGGIVFYLDENGGGKVFAPGGAQILDSWVNANSYCESLNYNGYTDWYIPNLDDLTKIAGANNAVDYGIYNTKYWSSELYTSIYYWCLNMGSGEKTHMNASSKIYTIPIRQF